MMREVHVGSTPKALAILENLKVKYNKKVKHRTKNIEMGSLLNIIMHSIYTLTTYYMIPTAPAHKHMLHFHIMKQPMSWYISCLILLFHAKSCFYLCICVVFLTIITVISQTTLICIKSHGLKRQTHKRVCTEFKLFDSWQAHVTLFSLINQLHFNFYK